jgi:hypothetical protein
LKSWCWRSALRHFQVAANGGDGASGQRQSQELCRFHEDHSNASAWRSDGQSAEPHPPAIRWRRLPRGHRQARCQRLVVPRQSRTGCDAVGSWVGQPH